MGKLRTEVENFYISYSDMITLLLIFFVYLFSISEIDPVKLAKAAESMKKELTGQSDTAITASTKLLEKIETEQQKLIKMQKEIQAYIAKHGLKDKVTVDYKDGQLELNMGDAVLFPLGQATLKPEAIDILQRLGGLFAKSDSLIVIEGHTDDIPIQSTVFPSNWELSAARAGSVARFLQGLGLLPTRFTVVGYSQYRPLVPNDSDPHRARNRRVKITLRPDIKGMIRQTQQTSSRAQ